MEHMEFWNKTKQPPPTVLKEIEGGRLKGMSDISPVWRYQVLTENFGVCGIGWKYEIVNVWTEPASNEEVVAFAKVNLWIKNGDSWSEAIPGIGGSKIVKKETDGLYSNDESYKMAVTDALSTACKMLGIAADIYLGKWDGSNYLRDGEKPAQKPPKIPSGERKEKPGKEITPNQWKYIKDIGKRLELSESEIVALVEWYAKKEGISKRHWKIAKALIPEDNFKTQYEIFMNNPEPEQPKGNYKLLLESFHAKGDAFLFQAMEEYGVSNIPEGYTAQQELWNIYEKIRDKELEGDNIPPTDAYKDYIPF